MGKGEIKPAEEKSGSAKNSPYLTDVFEVVYVEDLYPFSFQSNYSFLCETGQCADSVWCGHAGEVCNVITAEADFNGGAVFL